MTITNGKFIAIMLLLGIALAESGCGGAKADSGASAELLMSPRAGYTCFVIKNGAGDAVGGNCVKD
jgi:hypothetical protein